MTVMFFSDFFTSQLKSYVVTLKYSHYPYIIHPLGLFEIFVIKFDF